MPVKKHVNNLLEQLREIHVHLQNNLSDFVNLVEQKTKQWIENPTESDMTFKDVVAMVTTANTRLLDHVQMIPESSKPKSATEETQTAQDRGLETSHKEEGSKELESASHQDTKQKIEDEMKHWKDNFVTDIETTIEQLSQKQKKSFKNLRKKVNDQDTYIKELNKAVEELKKSTHSNKTIDKLSIEIKEYEANIQKVNETIQDLRDKMDEISKQTESQSNLISAFEEDNKKNLANSTKKIDDLYSKNVVISKLLQQRFIPIDKLIENVIQKLGATKNKNEMTKKKETNVLRLSRNFLDSANHQVKETAVGFIALDGHMDDFGLYTKYNHTIRNKGNHFNLSTGEFIAPVDGLYIASLSVKQTGLDTVEVSIEQRTKLNDEVRVGTVYTKNKSDEVSGTYLLWMKAGDQIFSDARYMDCTCTHFSCFLIGA